MIKFNVSKIEGLDKIKSNLKSASKKAQFAFDNQILKDSNRYIPVDTHTLERSGLIYSDLGRGKIIWSTPYAAKVYYGERHVFSKDINPYAGPLWFERAKSIHLKEWIKILEKAVKDNL